MKELRKKVVLITGACGQLGTELSRTYVERGWTVCITDIDLKKLEELAKNLNQISTKKQFFFQMDITSEESVLATLKLIEDQNITIDALVNNAGTAVFSDFSARTKEEFMKVLEVNLFGTFNCINKIGNHMVTNNISGAIVNIGSIYGVVSSDPKIYTDCLRKNSEVYSASKAGIIQLTNYFAIHLAENDIRVNCVSPGGIFNDQGDDFVNNYSKKTPARKMAKPQEIVQAIIYLSDNQTSSYISGQNLIVDGGLTSW